MKIFLEMVNIVFLFFAELLEFLAVIVSLPSKFLADVSSFFYGCSRALDNNDQQDDINDGSVQ